MTSSIHTQQCPECSPEGELVFWRDLPMNETIREYVRNYVSPPANYYATIEEALGAWGQDFNPEDCL